MAIIDVVMAVFYIMKESDGRRGHMNMDVQEYLPFLIPLLLLQLVLMVTALVVIIRQEHFRYLNKIVWIIIVLVLAFSMPWLYGLFIISLILLASTLFTNSFIAVLSSVVAVVIVMLIAGIHPDIAEYLPQYLIGNNVGLLAGEIAAGDVVWPMVITAAVSLVFILLAVIRFKKVPMN